MNKSALEQLRSSLVQAYRAHNPNSARWHERAARVLPGGVSGNLRYFAPYPLYMSHGEGCTTTDVDGNDYVDCFLLNGPLLLGHRPAPVVQAMNEHASTGSLVLNPTVLIECAELLCDIVPCAEKVRFLNSGTEAVMAAVRYARAFTGRKWIIKFYGHYHGQDDQFLVGAGAQREAFGSGVPDSAYACTLTLPFNDIEAVRQVLQQRGDEIAAVVLDPAMHSGGLWGTTAEYLRELRGITTQKGVVLLFDEVITGFRLAPGGAQELHGVTPDLVTLAKALGAGEKVAAVAGRADIMSVVDPVAGDPKRRVFQSGTGNDGTMALAAAAAAMRMYRAHGEGGGYTRLAQLGEKLATGLRAAFRAAGVPAHVNHNGSMLQLFFTDLEPSFAGYNTLDQTAVNLFYLALLTRGVMLSLPTSNHIYLSFEHGEAEVENTLAAAAAVLSDFRFSELF